MNAHICSHEKTKISSSFECKNIDSDIDIMAEPIVTCLKYKPSVFSQGQIQLSLLCWRAHSLEKSLSIFW